MIDGHPLEYAYVGQHGQDRNSNSSTANWYSSPPRSSPSLSPSRDTSVKRQSSTGVTAKAIRTSPMSSASASRVSTAPRSATLTIPIPVIPPLPPPPSSSSSSIPPSPQSQTSSSSPSTTAFVTPAESVNEVDGGSASRQQQQQPSSSSPNPRCSQSQLAAALAALHAQNHPSSPTARPISTTRPAPPSPIASRRQSTRSTISGTLSLSRPVSRPVSGLVLIPDIKGEGEGKGVTNATTATDKPLPFIPLASSPSSRPAAIIIRDYAFQDADDRYHGLGPLVPKWNRVERLIRILVDAARDDDEARERRRRRKERKERKERRKCERAKRKKKKKKEKKKGWNGWSEDEGGNDKDEDEGDEEDNGWTTSSDSVESSGSDDSDESGGNDMYDEHGFTQEGYHHHYLHLFHQQHETGSFSPTEPQHHQHHQPSEEPNNNGEDEDSSHIPSDGPLLPGLYRALYAFEPEGEAEMGLEEGQVVRVVGRGGGVGWAVVVDEREGRERLGLGGHALVPESYLEVVRVED